jgi:hypothetical protein
VRFVDPPEGHGNGEKAGIPERFDARIDFFEVSAERLLPFVDATHDLGPWRERCGRPQLRGERTKSPIVKGLLVGQVEEPALVEFGVPMQETDQLADGRSRQSFRFIRLKPQQLAELEELPGALLGRLGRGWEAVAHQTLAKGGKRALPPDGIGGDALGGGPFRKQTYRKEAGERGTGRLYGNAVGT